MPRWDHLTISVDFAVARQVEEAAAEDGVSVSAWMADAARQALRIRAGLAAVAEWEREHGALTEEEMAAARLRISVYSSVSASASFPVSPQRSSED